MSIDIAAVTDAINGIRPDVTNAEAVPILDLGLSAIGKAIDIAQGTAGFLGWASPSSSLPGETARENLRSSLQGLRDEASGADDGAAFPDVAAMKQQVIQAYVELDAAGDGRQEDSDAKTQLFVDAIDGAKRLAAQAAAAAESVGLGLGGLLFGAAALYVAVLVFRR